MDLLTCCMLSRMHQMPARMFRYFKTELAMVTEEKRGQKKKGVKY